MAAGAHRRVGPTGSVALVMVGDELLDGRVRESNSVYLQERLAAHRIAVASVHIVADTVDRIRDAIVGAVAHNGAVVVSGGLGPTPDDLSREALALVAGEELVLDPTLLRDLQERFQRRQRPMPESNRRQALRTPSGVAVPNPRGTAPGLWHEIAGVPVVLLPGVPAELMAMWEQTVEPRLLERLPAGGPRRVRLRLVRVSESRVADIVATTLADAPDVDAAFCVHRFGVDVLLRSTGEEADLGAAAGRLATAVRPHLYAIGDAELPEVLLDALAARGETLAVAESCTGGLLAKVLTDVAGSSRVFQGGVVAYSNAVKVAALDVDAELLRREGAVSESVALAMARGARSRLATTWALATTGIAGPSGGTVEKPVGTIWLGIAGPEDRLASERLQLWGDRKQNRDWTVAASLDLLRRHLGEDAGAP